MTPQDEEIHAQLLALMRQYFEENQAWLAGGSYASSIRLRHLLSAIRKTCSARRVAVREWQVDKRQQLDERKVIRAQKGKGKEAGNDN